MNFLLLPPPLDAAMVEGSVRSAREVGSYLILVFIRQKKDRRAPGQKRGRLKYSHRSPSELFFMIGSIGLDNRSSEMVILFLNIDLGFVIDLS